jgi:hypothetical protein
MIMIKRILLTTVAVGAICGAVALNGAQAQVLKDTQKEINPGLNAESGQINPGIQSQAPAGAPPGQNQQSGKGGEVSNQAPPSNTHAASNQPIPSPQEARAALLAPDSPDPAIGQVGMPPSGDVQSAKTATGDSPSGNAQSQEAQNTKSSPSQAAGGSAGSNETTGNAPAADAAQQAARQTSPNKPIASTTQTLPAKYSKRNDILDRLPTMAWPFRLDDQARAQIFKAVMADKGKTVELGKIGPADQLPADIALEAMHPLPQQLAGEPILNNIQVVKGNKKVLLVNPATRIVVDVIEG